MKRFRVSGIVTGSKLIGEFEAESAEEAKEMAYESGEVDVNICHSCANECDDAQILELDAEEIK